MADMWNNSKWRFWNDAARRRSNRLRQSVSSAWYILQSTPMTRGYARQFGAASGSDLHGVHQHLDDPACIGRPGLDEPPYKGGPARVDTAAIRPCQSLWQLPPRHEYAVAARSCEDRA